MTFKDLKKRISISGSQQTRSFDKLQNKPFWIWNIEEHKQEDVRTKGYCCFNHIIGLPIKEELEKPIFDYQQLLYEALLSPDICNPLNHVTIDQIGTNIDKIKAMGVEHIMFGHIFSPIGKDMKKMIEITKQLAKEGNWGNNNKSSFLIIVATF
jgi:hypothetical protein